MYVLLRLCKNMYLKMQKYVFTTNNAPQTPTFPKPKTETAEGSVKHVQNKQQDVP